MASRRWPEPPAVRGDWPRAFAPGPDGATLAVYEHAAANASPEYPRGVVCLTHDIGEHAGRYGDAAAALAAQGVQLCAQDLRGHGATRAPDAPLGVFADRHGLDRVVEDAVIVAERARAAHPGAPVIGLGLGGGGLIVLNVVLVRPDAFDGVAVWCADARPEHARRLRRATALAAVFGPRRPSKAVHARGAKVWNAPFQPARTAADWRSSDPAEVDRYLSDRLCGWAPSASLWRDIADAIDRVNDPGAWGAVPRQTPFHLLGGGDDPSTDGGAAIMALDARLREMGFTDVARVIFEGARHDVLHDGSRGDAVRHLTRWLHGVAES